MNYLNLFLILLFFNFTSCEDTFQYSPYVSIDKLKYRELNNKNYNEIKNSIQNQDTFAFTIISDSHAYYDDFYGAINTLNRNVESAFTIHTGDFSDCGLLWEYNNNFKIIEKLNKPYLVVIGNHDYLSNGSDIYNHYFGKKNFSIRIGKNKLVFFDDIVWESIIHHPDFEWLENEISSTGSDTNVFVVTHIPPWTDQLVGEKEEIFRKMMAAHDVKAVFCGHEHNFEMKDYYQDSVIYAISGSVCKRNYLQVNITGKTFNIKCIKF
ncbi:MAG: metallophosphoesterase [Lentimicrobiaceae bacterium]|nr:metallophosphoesterase [Lentimicrobiaceae bacterium]